MRDLPAPRPPTPQGGAKAPLPERYPGRAHRWETRQRRKRDSSTRGSHASSGRNAEERALAIGGVRERLLHRQRRARRVVCPNVDELERMRCRLDVRKVELGDFADGLEDRIQLLAKAFDLVLGQLEPRQPCDVQNLVSRNCHLPNPFLSPEQSDGTSQLRGTCETLCALKKRAPFGARSRFRFRKVLDRLDVHRLQALVALLDVELNTLPSGQPPH